MHFVLIWYLVTLLKSAIYSEKFEEANPSRCPCERNENPSTVYTLGDKKHEHDFNSIIEVTKLDEVQFRPGRTLKAVLSNLQLTDTRMLAHKFAKEALESSEIQNTMKKLEDLNSYQKKSKDNRLRGNSRKRIKRFRVLAKPDFRLIKTISAERNRIYRSPRKIFEPNILRFKNLREKWNKKILSSSTDCAIPITSLSKVIINVTEPSHNESIISRLMKTTTNDPTKKYSGDQGMEYSDYYNNENEFSNNIDETSAKSGRYAREIPEELSVNNNYLDYDHNSESENEDTKNFYEFNRYPSKRLFHRWNSWSENYPQFESNLNNFRLNSDNQFSSDDQLKNYNSNNALPFTEYSIENNVKVKRTDEITLTPPLIEDNKTHLTGLISKAQIRNEDTTNLQKEQNPLQLINDTNSKIETKEVAKQILNEVLSELREMKIDTQHYNTKEGFPCRLTGSWRTTQAGVDIHMKVIKRKIKISFDDVLTSHTGKNIISSMWKGKGNAPFRIGAPFSLVATNNETKSMAVFVGTCKICQGVETVQGVWSIAQEPKDCKDFQVITNVVNDVFWRHDLDHHV